MVLHELQPISNLLSMAYLHNLLFFKLSQSLQSLLQSFVRSWIRRLVAIPRSTSTPIHPSSGTALSVTVGVIVSNISSSEHTGLAGEGRSIHVIIHLGVLPPVLLVVTLEKLLVLLILLHVLLLLLLKVGLLAWIRHRQSWFGGKAEESHLKNEIGKGNIAIFNYAWFWQGWSWGLIFKSNLAIISGGSVWPKENYRGNLP